MIFSSDRQRRAIFANMFSRNSSKFSLKSDSARFGVSDFSVFKNRFSDESRKKDFLAYDMWDTGMSIPEIAKTMGVSEGAVKGAIIGYGVDLSLIGYKVSDAVDYYRDIEGLDISELEARSMLDRIKKGEDFGDILESIRLKSKEKLHDYDEDERSSDYVSKGEWSKVPIFSKKRDKGYTETVDGYECDYCGDEFSTKTAASIHASACDEKEKDDVLDYNDDGVPVDNFFTNDDGTI